ncbi:MAG TPA: hypothetical protein DEQ09_12735 [Bacteroidales bacterium]|nr:hypothetical protein [Bacteroidales bacterium]
MEKVRNMKKHVTVVGTLHIVFAILGLIGALVVFMSINFAQSFVAGEDIPLKVLTAIKIFVPAMIALVSILSIVGGIGLFSYSEWARILIIVMSAINCLNVPIGTAKGVYSIWTLLQDETIRMFRGEEPIGSDKVTTRTN